MTSPPSSGGGAGSGFGISTIMVCLLFGTNALLFAFFQLVRFGLVSPMHSNSVSISASDEKNKGKNSGGEEKVMSKPFIGSLECFTNLTSEMFRLGMIMALTYIAENNWIFDHSGKEYSRDLFIFVLIVFFGYAFYTIKPVHDLSLLSREQSEEWKGWMQFIFLLYHYFHAEEVYNSVRVMITCYVWMTGFGNFSFFYMKGDYSWLRVMQMMWRLNFSVLLLMWTHGNTYILYYICPMHTFYFLMVYLTMYIFSSSNYSKWGIRLKLFVLGVIIYIVWDINGGLFDFLFGFLGTDSVIGAGRGSVWEYYFRTSLDHWSSFLGMIFALNFPLAEQYFVKAKGWPLVLTAVLMAVVTIWWGSNIYVMEKMTYNLSHSYTAIIPLTSYIFFRNITPAVRSGVSMSLHDLGKTTLETYLLQHHIWLTSNAKTLLTIVPNHPWVNFALATVLFFVVSKELYRLTMSLRGMMIPDDKTIAFNNIIGMSLVVGFLFFIASLLHAAEVTLFGIMLSCMALMMLTLFLFSRFARQLADNFVYQQWYTRALTIVAICFGIGLMGQIIFSSSQSSPSNSNGGTSSSIFSLSKPYIGNTPACLASISQGHWVKTKCTETPPNVLNKLAYCQSDKWVWDSNTCPVGKMSTTKARSVFKGKKIVFIGDSIMRSAYHQFNALIDPSYSQNVSAAWKHTNLSFKPGFAMNSTISFVWAPTVKNITYYMGSVANDKNSKIDFTVCGAATWDALYTRNIKDYSADLDKLATSLPGGNTINVWLQPTKIIDGKLPTTDKQQFMTESIIQQYRNAVTSSRASQKFNVILNPMQTSLSHESGSSDGVHYSEEVYKVIAQMCANAYAMHFPSFYASKLSVPKATPKPTGSMSFPFAGALVLALSAVMLITMDGFLGLGYISLRAFGKCYDWEAAYSGLHKKLLNSHNRSPPSRDVSTQEVEGLLGNHNEDPPLEKTESGADGL